MRAGLIRRSASAATATLAIVAGTIAAELPRSVPVAAQTVPAAIDMVTDYTAKTITLTARIDFYDSSTTPQQSVVSGIVKAIESRWNGFKFKCFTVIVKVDAGIVASKSAVRPNAVDIRLDSGRVEIRSGVTALQTGNYLSDNPGDRLEPVRTSGAGGSAWSASALPAVFAHEFGHVVGLDDNYLDSNPLQTLPNANKDMMFSHKEPMSGEMITRVVRRNNTNGQLDESKVKCPLTMDAGPASIAVFVVTVDGLFVHAYACDYDPPSSDPSRRPKPISWTGTAGVSGSYSSPMGSASGAFQGPISFQSEAHVRFAFSPAPGNLDFTGIYGWTPDGLPAAYEPLTLNGAPSWSVGLALMPSFKHGAAECPP